MSRPTIEDLRVKLCYICREEELFDKPEDPPRAWTHPCNCTLIAHQSCLLEWIRTSQADAARAANALKCPQCGAKYEIDSYNPPILRILDAGNKALFVLGRMVSVAGMVTILASLGSGIYIISTAYGAYALKQFLGKGMYDLLLTDDPSLWPWHAFFNLPLIPFSLILSRVDLPVSVLPILPLLLAWPSSTPVTREIRLPDTSASVHHPWSTWPPSPAFVALVLLPLARTCYNHLFRRLSHWVLTPPHTPPRAPSRYVFAVPAFQIHIAAGNLNAQQPAANANANANANAHPDADVALPLAAEDTIHLTGSTLGRLLGGALLLPPLSAFMGSLLLRLSSHAALLRRFLGLRPSPARGGYPETWAGLGMSAAARVLVRTFGGTRAWAECDPVWWRNALGLGVFVVAKDCVQLLHLWYAKAELGSRTIRNKSFEGVDVLELDLIDRD